MFDIVMPLFNKEDFVAATIGSVLRQSSNDWHLWIVDDGSRDASAAVVEGFADPRITLLQQANAGPGAARNTGIAAGAAPWIAFLDADDIWMPDHLEELDKLRRDFPDAALIGTTYIEWAGGKLARPDQLKPVNRRRIRYFREVALRRRPFYTSSAAFSRRAVEAVGPLRPVLIGDETELWARLALHGTVAGSNKTTVLYRVGSGGITDRNVHKEELWTGQALELPDVSLPVATLAARLSEIDEPVLRQDVSDYIDYEIEFALLKAVRENRIGDARKLRGLFLGPLPRKARIASILAAFPRPLGQHIMYFIFSFKRSGRGLVSGGTAL